MARVKVFVPDPDAAIGAVDIGAPVTGGLSEFEKHDFIVTSTDLTVPSGTVWEFDSKAVLMVGNGQFGDGEGASLYNYGQLIVTGDSDAYGIQAYENAQFVGQVIENHGLLQVTGGFNYINNFGDPWVDGIDGEGALPKIWNTSTGQIVVSGDYAHGIYSWDPAAPIVNDGLIKVSGNGNTDGMLLINEGFQITNNGQIEVNGVVGASSFGIISGDGEDTIVNNGTIEVTAQSNPTQTVGIAWNVSEAGEFIINHGTITAGVAIWDLAYSGTGTSHVFNDGTINGAIELNGGSDFLTNAGTIKGAVSMGDGDDSYVSEHGSVVGVVDGGAGIDTVSCDRSDATTGITFVVTDITKVIALPDGTQVVNFENFDLTGGSGNDSFTLASGDDVLQGGRGNDTLNGGGGSDTASYADAGSGVTVDLTISGPQNVGGNDGTDTLISIENLTGSAFNDTLKGNDGDNVLTSGAGSDVLLGGNGDDTFELGANLSSGDHIDGGSGTDTLVLSGDYSAGFTFGAETMVSVEKLVLTGIYDYTLVSNDAMVPGGQMLIVDGTATNDFNFDGSAETDGTFTILGGGGHDHLIGGAGNDVIHGGVASGYIDASRGGDDTVVGGYYDDTLYFGAAFTASDRIDGGALTDTLVLSGNYAAGVTFAAATMVNVEVIQLGAGFSYKLVTNDATVAENQMLTVTGSSLGAGQNLTFDGSSEKDGSFTVVGGAGDDIFVAGTNPNGSDVFNGGSGSDTLDLSRQGSGVTLDLGKVGNQVLNHNHNIILNSVENVIGTAFADTFYGSTGDNVVSAGAGNDTIDLHQGGNDQALGGDGNDTITMGAALNAADRIDGGAGLDTVTISGDYSAGLVFGPATMINVEYLVLGAGFSYRLTTDDATVAAGQTLTVDASKLGSGDSLGFDGSSETNGNFVVMGGGGDDQIVGGGGNDNLSGGAGDDVLDLSAGGSDIAAGGSGNDTFLAGASFTAADEIDGGSGNDMLVIAGDYSGGLVFGASTMTNVETLVLTKGNSYDLVLSDGNVAAGATLLVDASKLGGGDALIFDGSAESDGSYVVKGGKGDDHIVSGAGTDKLLGGKGNDVLEGGGGADLLDGGKGHDTFVYAAAADSTGTGFDTIEGFNAKQDHIDLWIGVTGIDAAIAHGALSLATFDSDLAAAVGAANLAANHAVLFTPDQGGLAGDTFLIVDANGVAGYQAGQDLVIEFDHAVKLDHLKVANFI